MDRHVVWRTSPSTRRTGVVLLVSFAGIGGLALRDLLRGDGEAGMFLALLPFVFLAIYRRCWWTQLVLTSDRIVVRNAVKRYVVPLTSVVGQYGIVVDTRKDEPVVISVAQKGLATELLGGHTYADEILAGLAAAVAEAYRRVGASPPEEVHHAVQPAPPRKRPSVAVVLAKWVSLLLALCCLAILVLGVAVLVTDGEVVEQAGTTDSDWGIVLLFPGLTALFAMCWFQLRRGTRERGD